MFQLNIKVSLVPPTLLFRSGLPCWPWQLCVFFETLVGSISREETIQKYTITYKKCKSLTFKIIGQGWNSFKRPLDGLDRFNGSRNREVLRFPRWIIRTRNRLFGCMIPPRNGEYLVSYKRVRFDETPSLRVNTVTWVLYTYIHYIL